MKEYNSKNIEVSSNSDDIEGIDMTIDAKNMGFVFDIMFSQMYRDPIGSIIREITSNCFDSHIEAKVNDAVVIEIGEDDGGSYISFTDVGIGISPERMINIYSKPATSTKRDTNDQIGFWGLGSKSPLAYQDFFHLTTVYNNIKYEYVVHKGEKGPRIDKIDEQEITERNGSIVKIYIKSWGDKQTFKNRLVEQLRYFDNVYVKGAQFNNDYKIYEGKNFKFRTDSRGDTLHIAIGKVYYPIDWTKIDIKKIRRYNPNKSVFPIQLPFALNFKVGDLPVTPERESIRYITIEKEDGTTVDTADLVTEKINAMLDEIQDMAGTHEPLSCNNVIDYYKASEERYVNIKIVDRLIDVTDYVIPKELLYTPLAHLPIKFNIHNLYTFNEYKVTKEMQMHSPLKSLKTSATITIKDVINTFVVREENPHSKLKEIVKDYIRHLAKQEDKFTIYFTKYSSNARWLWKQIKFPNIKELDYSKYNKLKLFKQVRNVIRSEFTAFSVDIEDIVITDDFRTKWLAKNKHKVDADEDQVKVKTFYRSDEEVVNLDIIKNYKGFILYGFSKHEKKLRSWFNLFKDMQGSSCIDSLVYTIRHKDERKLIPLPNCIDIESFMNDHPVFRKIATSLMIAKSKIWTNYNFSVPATKKGTEESSRFSYITRIFVPLGEKLRQLELSRIYSKETITAEEELITEIVDVATQNNWIDPALKADIEKVERYFDGLELLKYISVSEESLPLVVDFIKLNNKPINKEWEDMERWQIELCNDIINRMEYWQELSKAEKPASPNYAQREKISVAINHYMRKVTNHNKALIQITTLLNNHKRNAEQRIKNQATASRT